MNKKEEPSMLDKWRIRRETKKIIKYEEEIKELIQRTKEKALETIKLFQKMYYMEDKEGKELTQEELERMSHEELIEIAGSIRKVEVGLVCTRAGIVDCQHPALFDIGIQLSIVPLVTLPSIFCSVGSKLVGSDSIAFQSISDALTQYAELKPPRVLQSSGSEIASSEHGKSDTIATPFWVSPAIAKRIIKFTRFPVASDAIPKTNKNIFNFFILLIFLRLSRFGINLCCYDLFGVGNS